MADDEPKPATAHASEEVHKLQISHDLLLDLHSEDHHLVKECKKQLEAAQAKSSATAQLHDKKHIAEAVTQATKYRENTVAAFDKIATTERERLDSLKQACEEQKRVMA